MNFLKNRDWKLGTIVLIVASLFVSCAVESTGFVYDDIYLDDTEINEQDEAFAKQQEQEKKLREERIRAYQQAMEQENSENEEAEEEYKYNPDDTVFNMDDYYDYAYAARIKRFHSPTIIYNYYDDYYTDLCWYDPDPMLWGTSIYLGYRWWYPTYSYYWTWNYGWGWHRPFYWHNPWAYDYYAWHHHPWGYYHAPWYYNSWDRNSHFYNRPDYNMSRSPRHNNRNTQTGFRYNNNTGTNGVGENEKTFGERYTQRYGNPTTRTTRTNTTNVRSKNTNNNNSVNNNTRKRNTNSNSTIKSNNNTRTYTPAKERQPRNSNEYRRNNTNNNNNNRSINTNRSNTNRSSSMNRSSNSHSSSRSTGGGRRR